MNEILVIGGAGGLSKIFIEKLSSSFPDKNILVVDNREVSKKFNSPNIKFQKIRYARSDFESIFSNNKFKYIYHLGRLGHAKAQNEHELTKRLNQNIVGTNKILELCLTYKVKKVIALSTYHVYGALNDNSTFLKENSPLRASIKHSELRDVVEMDQMLTSWMWENKDNIETIILRPCSIIGPNIKNAMVQYLTSSLGPTPIDFNPPFQFVHEEDMADILLNCIDTISQGVYNIAPEDTVTIRKSKKILGTNSIPTPIFILENVASFLNKTFMKVPHYLIDYIKYPSIIDSKKIREQLGANYLKHSSEESIQSLKTKQ